MKKILPFLQFLFCASFSFGQNLITIQDTTICPGNYIHIRTIADDDVYYYYRWRPNYHLSDSAYPSPWVWPDTTTTYYFYAFKPDSVNLVYNGDFSLGNTGFTSQYVYKIPSGGTTLWNEGTYTVTSAGVQVHSNFSPNYDHTLGTAAGKFLAINGTDAANTIIWSQTLSNVTPNTDYVFYAWVTSLTSHNPAVLQFSINGTLLDQPFSLTGAAEWNQFYTIWNSGNSTSAVITIVNQNIILDGNDFGIDDIFFSPIYPDIDSVTVAIGYPDSTHSVVKQCAQSSYVFNDKHIIIESGIYVDTLKTVLGCDSITSLDSTFYPEVEVNLIENQLLCKSDTTYIILDPMEEYHTYKWSTGDSSRELRVEESGVYYLTVTNEIGCEATTSVEVIFVDTPKVTIVSNTDNFCEEYKMELSIETEAPEILWSTGDITPDIEVTKFGTYYVTASEHHCTYVDSFQVVFCCPMESYLPNVITPSDCNGINDYLEFSKQLPFEKINLYILDRWGKRIYQTTSPEFKWGGTVNNSLRKGLYYYVIEFEDGCSFHGSITVL